MPRVRDETCGRCGKGYKTSRRKAERKLCSICLRVVRGIISRVELYPRFGFRTEMMTADELKASGLYKEPRKKKVI